MKKELTYHGQMMKQEAEALLKALKLGDESVVMAIGKRLNNFAIDVVDGKASIFEEKKEATFRDFIKNSFRMAVELGATHTRRTFEMYRSLYEGDTEKLNMLREVLESLYERSLRRMDPSSNYNAEVCRECIETIDYDLNG